MHVHKTNFPLIYNELIAETLIKTPCRLLLNRLIKLISFEAESCLPFQRRSTSHFVTLLYWINNKSLGILIARPVYTWNCIADIGKNNKPIEPHSVYVPKIKVMYANWLIFRNFAFWPCTSPFGSFAKSTFVMSDTV